MGKTTLKIEFYLFLLGLLHLGTDVLHLDCRVFDDVLACDVGAGRFAGFVAGVAAEQRAHRYSIFYY